jgi:hypothetical protein
VRHNEEVMQHVPAEKLLVYEVGEGWGPLCEFLGVEVPDEPFPHLNDSEVFRGRIRRIRVLTSVALTLGVSLAGLVLLRLGWRRGHRGPPGALESLLGPADPEDPPKAP